MDDGDLNALALSGFGHFTTMLVDADGGVRGLSLHLRRLSRDCAELFGVTLDPQAVLAAVRDGLRGAPLPTVARVTVFDPDLSIGHVTAPARPRVVVTTRPAPAAPPEPLTVGTVRHTRFCHHVKHAGLFDAVRLRRLAAARGVDDALYVDGRECVAEGPTWNVGFVHDDRLVWPASDHLPGVTEELLRREHGDADVRPVPAADLPRMQAALATNAVTGVRPIAAIDGWALDAAHPLLATLRDAYAAIVPEPLLPR